MPTVGRGRLKLIHGRRMGRTLCLRFSPSGPLAYSFSIPSGFWVHDWMMSFICLSFLSLRSLTWGMHCSASVSLSWKPQLATSTGLLPLGFCWIFGFWGWSKASWFNGVTFCLLSEPNYSSCLCQMLWPPGLLIFCCLSVLSPLLTICSTTFTGYTHSSPVQNLKRSIKDPSLEQVELNETWEKMFHSKKVVHFIFDILALWEVRSNFSPEDGVANGSFLSSKISGRPDFDSGLLTTIGRSCSGKHCPTNFEIKLEFFLWFQIVCFCVEQLR